MGDHEFPKDPIDEAIAATEPLPEGGAEISPVRVFKSDIVFPNGRPAGFYWPLDATPQEILSLLVAMLSDQTRQQWARAQMDALPTGGRILGPDGRTPIS
jgi:hypothetical protein